MASPNVRTMAANTKTSARAARPGYLCNECGWEAAKWVGRCGECQAWGTVVEKSAPKSRVQAGPVTSPALRIGEIAIEDSHSRTSGVPELDRVLEVAAQTARQGQRVLYVTGEESAAQVRMRADRTGAIEEELFLAAETDLGAVLGHTEAVKPTLLVVDSVQTISANDVDGVPGGVTQVKEVSAALIRMAKLRNITRVLEHLVDVVLHFEGERTSRLRLVRAMKNRYGPVDEVGCFDLSSEGIVAITDPTGLFLDTRHGPVPGTCVAVAMEGRRPLLSEVQALVTHTPSERPRRTTSGVDSARVAMILAILQQHAGVRLHAHDVFVSSVGGARLTEPSNDLAIALAITSAYRGTPLGRNAVAIGELGLSGELRRVRDVSVRLSEAGRMGFRSAMVPAETRDSAGTSRVLDGLRVVDVDNIRRALHLLDLEIEGGARAGLS